MSDVRAIVGGAPAEASDWPDAVAIDGLGGFLCTGTLIAPDWVLTAGHCVSGALAVTVGALESEGSPKVAIDSAISYPDFLRTYDVGLLHLAQPSDAPLRPWVRDCLTSSLLDETPATAAGYGATVSGASEWNPVLYEVDLPIVDADCADVSRGCQPFVLPDGELIAGGDGLDTCSGDSGGPLVMDLDGVSHLVGVTSRAALPADVACGDGGIFVRVDAIVDWIETEIGQELAKPDCGGPNSPPVPLPTTWTLEPGERRTFVAEATDAEGDDLTFVLDGTGGPIQASVASDGTVTVEADDATGVGAIALRILDDADPPADATATWTVVVSEPWLPPDSAGCSTVAAPWVAMVLLALRRRRLVGVGFVAGCTVSPSSTDASSATPPTVMPSDVTGFQQGDVITVQARIATPRTLDEASFYVVDDAADHGLRVAMAGAFAGWPPEPGTPVLLEGVVGEDADGTHRLTLRDLDDAVVLGPTETLTPLAYDPAAERIQLVGSPAVLTSLVDPAGAADLDVGELGGLFTTLALQAGAEGDLVALSTGGRLHPRDASDWTPRAEGGPPAMWTLADLRATPPADGTPVTLDDLVVATPMTRDGRLAVLQDASGAGLWLDTEGFGLAATLGEVGQWTGEWRDADGAPRLRSWLAPVPGGARASVEAAVVADGALLPFVATDPGAADALGERVDVDGTVYDDAILSLEGLEAGSVGTAAIRVDSAGTRWVVVDTTP